MTINITARQFAFEFSYPQAGGKQVVSPVLYLPKGQPVVFKLRALDVIHSFFVPNFSEKLDAVPGITTTLRVTPTRLGTYPVECTELCGAGHSLMRAAVRVVTPDGLPDLAALAEAQRASAGRDAAAQRGPARDPGRGQRARVRLELGLGQLELGIEPRDQRRRRQGRVHGLGGLRQLPHARGRRAPAAPRAPNLGTAIVPDAKKAGMALKPFIHGVDREAERVHRVRLPART